MGGMQNWDVKGNFISVGKIQTIGDLVLKTANALIVGKIQSEGNIDINAVNKIIIHSLYHISQFGNGNSYVMQQYITQSASIKAKGSISVKAEENINIVGSEIIGDSVYLKSSSGQISIVPIALYNEVTNWGKNIIIAIDH